jgi:putative ABC transport system permease protein
MAQAYRENLKQAMDTLRSHKMRSALTVFGVVLGVSVIMLVSALITGFDQKVEEQINQVGADTVFISKWDRSNNGTPPLEERLRKPLRPEDAEAIEEACPAVKSATAWVQPRWDSSHAIRTAGGQVTSVDYRGVQAAFGMVYANATLKEGRFISEGDDLHREKVAVIGESVAPALFPDGHVLGKDAMIDGSAFQVIGVLEKPKGGFGADEEDRRVLIPYRTFMRVYPAADEVNIRAEAYPGMVDKAMDRIREVMERRRNIPHGGKDNFSISTAAEQVAQFHQIVDKVALAMVVLSSVGLLVGGIGVMNIMLVSVTERTREIGGAQGHWGDAKRHHLAVPAGGDDLDRSGRIVGFVAGERAGDLYPADPQMAGDRAGLGGGHGGGDERRHRTDFWGVAGDEGRQTGPRRSATV